MENMTVTPTQHDFSAVHAAMRRYVDANILSGVSSAVLQGRDLVVTKFLLCLCSLQLAVKTRIKAC